MIRGSGAPVAELWEGDSQVGSTLTLPRPTERRVQDYEPVEQPLGTNAYGDQVTEFLGYRYRVILVWILTASNRDAYLATVCAMGEHRGTNRRIRFQPHSDVELWESCEVVSNPEKPYGGMALGDEIVIELRGLNLKPKKPNLALDMIGIGAEGVV